MNWNGLKGSFESWSILGNPVRTYSTMCNRYAVREVKGLMLSNLDFNINRKIMSQAQIMEVHF